MSESVDERIARVTFTADGLVAAIIQQWDTREVLMLGWMDAEALRRTLTEGRVTFWSRSRQEYWRKGDTSGNIQLVRGARLTATATPCWSRSSRSVPRATPAPGRASTPTTSTRCAARGRRVIRRGAAARRRRDGAVRVRSA